MRFLIALAISAVATPLVGWLGRAVGLVDRPTSDPLKIHARPVPFIGGVSVVGAVLVTSAVLGWNVRGEVLGAIVAALALGLADDARPLPPWLRLVLQAGIGALIGWALPLGAHGALGGIATAFVVVAVINAVNLLDGQDGLVAGVAAIAAVALAFVVEGAGGSRAVELALGLAGALVGFLAWNRPPAAVFLGNGGAYAVGLMLAVLAATAGARDGMRGALAAGLCLMVPAFELVLTVIRRVGSGSKVVHGDRLHSYDRLTARVGGWRSTLAFWGLGAVGGALGVLAAASSLVGAAVVSAVAAGAALAIALVMGTRTARVRQSR